MAVLIALGGLATDTAVWFAQQRDLRSATDAAALAAAGGLDRGNSPTTAAQNIVQAYGFTPSSTVVSVDEGYYCPGATQNFSTGSCANLAASAFNAVRVTTQRSAQAFLFRALGTPGSRAPVVISTVAVATEVNQAGLSAATGLATINTSQSALLNGILQSVTGSSINLSVAQYNGLLNANVDALTFLNALATQVGVSAGNYQQVLSSNATIGDLLNAAVSALGAQGSLANVDAKSGLGALQLALQGSTSINLAQIFDLGVWQNSSIGSGSEPAALHAGLNLYQLISFALELSNGSHFVTVPSSTIGIPNLACLNIAATAIEPAQSASGALPGFAFGPTGIQVHTAQVRLQLNLEVLNLQGVLTASTGCSGGSGAMVQVPLYVEADPGDAYIAGINCNGNPATDAQVLVKGETGIASVYLGQIPLNVMNNFSQPVPASAIQPVQILNLGIPGILTLASTTAKAAVNISSTGYQCMTFNQPGSNLGASQSCSPPPNPSNVTENPGVIGSPPWGASTGVVGTPVEITSGINLSSTLSSLTSNLSAQVCTISLLGGCLLPITLTGSGLGALYTVLNPLLTDLDTPINSLLLGLGVNLGNMYTEVTGVQCGYPVLVY